MTSASKNSRPVESRAAAPIVASLMALLASAGMTGCVDDFTAAAISNPATHHPIAFSSSPETLLVEIAPHRQGLSQNQAADVWRFVERFKAESTGGIRIELPGSARSSVTKSLVQIEEIIHNAGVDPRAVEIVRLGGKTGHAGAIAISYDRTIAVPPDCGDWSDDLGKNRERLPYNNFGCATQRNLALTVNNGRDLQGPQQEAPRSSERRSAQWSEYIGGGAAASSAATEAPAPQTK